MRETRNTYSIFVRMYLETLYYIAQPFSISLKQTELICITRDLLHFLVLYLVITRSLVLRKMYQ
jgi:hypothetical protein